MAYSNWGAFVKKNGERRKDKEDVGVFDTDESNVPSGYRIFANLLKNQGKEGEERKWHEHSHHAVLGDSVVRLCGYKCGAELWYIGDKGEVKQFELPNICETDGEIREAIFRWYPPEGKDGKIDFKDPRCGSYRYSARHYDGNMIDLTLTEPDGIIWSATCGYCYGAGWMDDDGKPLETEEK